MHRSRYGTRRSSNWRPAASRDRTRPSPQAFHQAAAGTPYEPAGTVNSLANGGAEQVPDAVGEGQAERSADDEPQDGAADAASAQTGAEGTGQTESDQDGGEDWAAGRGGTGHPDDDAGHRHDPVVGPQHRSPQPIQPPSGAAGMRLPGVSSPPLGPERRRASRHRRSCRPLNQ